MNDPAHPMIVILFSASWCTSCSKIDKNALLRIHENIRFYYVDLDKEDGQNMLFYVGFSQIPGILAIKNGIPCAPLQSSDIQKISWYIRHSFNI